MLCQCNCGKETKLSISRYVSGHNPSWIKQKGRKLSIETKEKIRQKRKLQINIGNKGKKLSEEHIKKLSLSHLGYKKSRETIIKSLGRRMMSSLEKKFSDIVLNNNLPYKFVGNGKFFIENKNPDFINTNGEKIAIEVFYSKHKMLISNKDKFGIGFDSSLLQKYKDERIKIFNKYGWEIKFFDETQVKEDIILKTLMEGLKS